MKKLTATLRLSRNLDGRTRERCPDIVFRDGETEIAAIRTDVESPKLPLADDSAEEIEIRDDALSRVIDEDAWLRDLARVLAPGGTLRFTVPAAGPMAWLDAMNVYRYIADISGRGRAPDAAFPTGWNRHYTDAYLRDMMREAGFAPPTLSRQNIAMNEAGMLAGLLTGNWLGGKKHTELAIFPRFGHRQPDVGNALIHTTWSVEATKRN